MFRVNVFIGSLTLREERCSFNIRADDSLKLMLLNWPYFRLFPSCHVFERSVDMRVPVFCFSERENRTYSHPRLYSERSGAPENPLR